jgi:hypothetical protein
VIVGSVSSSSYTLLNIMIARHRSYSTHSFNTSPQHQLFIYPSHSFSHTPEDYVLPRSDFVHNTSSARGYHENYFQGVSPSFARFTGHQHAQPDLIYPSARILVPEGQSAYVLLRQYIYSASLKHLKIVRTSPARQSTRPYFVWRISTALVPP